MEYINVFQRESGKIFHRTSTPGQEGCVLRITNEASHALSSYSHNIRFLHVAFDSAGESFVAGDYQGHVYLFDITKNRFNLVKKCGNPCTALAFTLKRNAEVLAAMSDYSIKCIDTVTKEQLAVMKGHQSAVNHISVHASGRYAISCSDDTAQLWDLETFQRKRKLNIKENVGVVKVFFLPFSNTILTCFKDDTVFAWEADTLQCKYQLSIPEGKSPCFKTFAASRDGRLLIGGGRSRFLHLWTLDTKNVLRIIELPKKVHVVKQIEFLPDSFDAGSNQIVGVLSQDGIMRFVNVYDCKLLFEIGSLNNRINNVAVSSNGRYISAVLDNGNIAMYDVQLISSEINKAPPPLVKVLKGNKKEQKSDLSNGSAATGKNASIEFGEKSKRGEVNSPTTKDLPEGLNIPRLQSILKGYGQYPAKYRMFIWRSVLRLPENHQAYGSLVDKGVHPAYDKVHQQYPIKSRKLLRILQRVLSALAHWSSIFGETDYLAMMSFPFIKLFQNNQLVCFEVIATILTNWCQHWFEYFPNPPINILGIVENVLSFHDKELLAHLIKHGCTSQIYAWPLLETLFSEVLTREEWLKLFDNVFSNHPSFLYMCVVAYCSVNRAPLMKCEESEDFKYFFHHKNAVDINRVLKEAYRLMDITPDDIHPENTLEPFKALTRGQYPVFNKYPKFIVDYQVQERERIRKEEVEYLKQRQTTLELQQETEKRQAEEEAWYRQQKLLQDAEERRRKLIAEEEQKLADQRTRLQSMNREVKMKELQLLDATKRKFLHFQKNQKEMELARLDDEIRRKVELRERETSEAVEDVDIKNMELLLQRKMIEQELMRAHCEKSQIQKNELEQKVELQQRPELQQRHVIFENSENNLKIPHFEERDNYLLPVGINFPKYTETSEVHNDKVLLGAYKEREIKNKEQDLHTMSHNKRQQLFQREGYLNDTTETESSTQFSLDRGQGRYDFEENERQLMSEVRQLRAKLAAESRNKKPPTSFHQSDELGVRKDI